jgi:LytS/YehU family sensor histidine kinase
MNQSKRFFFQAILWVFIWGVLVLVQNLELQFIRESIPTFSFQIVLIIFLIYYAAPKFLFRKKYLLFFLVSIFFLVFFSLIDGYLSNLWRLPPPDFLPNKKINVSPSILVHLAQSLILLIAYLIALFIEVIWFLQTKEQETILIKTEALESELKLLKSQINPHFLFNTLNNIYALTIIDVHKTQQSISYLSDMLRYVLYECEQAFVSPQKEVLYIENYIHLFSLKSSRKYAVEMKVQILDTTVRIAPMILIPFVENALKHSYIEKNENAFIDITLKVTSEVIFFEIKNSIPQIAFNKDEVGGIGLENISKRLMIVYPENHELRIGSTATIFKVELTIKLSKDA